MQSQHAIGHLHAISACNQHAIRMQSRHAIGHLLELGSILPQDHVTLPRSQHAEHLHHSDCDPQHANWCHPHAITLAINPQSACNQHAISMQSACNHLGLAEPQLAITRNQHAITSASPSPSSRMMAPPEKHVNSTESACMQ